MLIAPDVYSQGYNTTHTPTPLSGEGQGEGAIQNPRLKPGATNI